MTLLELRGVIAGYLQKTVADLTVNGVDLSLLALNQVRREAEMLHDFEFTRKHITVTVDGVDGGTLDDAILEGEPGCEVKTVIECGIYDDGFNMRPVEWTTVAESLERQRQNSPGFGPRYPTDWEATTGGGRYTTYTDLQHIAICGNDIWCVPVFGQHKLFDLEFEVYTFTPDWDDKTDRIVVSDIEFPEDLNGEGWPYGTYNGRPFYLNVASGGMPKAATAYAVWYRPGEWIISQANEIGRTPLTDYYSMAGTVMYPGGTYTPYGSWLHSAKVNVMPGSDVRDIWLRHGAQYLMWAAIVQINHLCKEFVFRQEGNLPPPEKLAEAALENFRQWDAFKYEQNRRHVY